MRAPRLRSGFTLVELLVVIAIIGILIAMLLPAVNSARESGRRANCGSNLHQLAMALRNYEQLNRCFPPALYIPPDENPSTNICFQMNWLIALLPQIDQGPLYKAFDLTKPISDPANREARGTQVPLLLCPSDVGANIRYSKSNEGDNWARGNYGANSSLAHLSSGNVGNKSTWQRGWCRGVMGANIACSVDEIVDGTSNTILVAELRIGLSEVDRRGTWAMGSPGASSLWGHGSDDGIGPNNCNSAADNILNCSEIWSSLPSGRLTKECMGCSKSSKGSQATARSRHPGGVMVAMVDGSVRFVSDHIEKASSWSLSLKDFRVWERISASADRLPVDLRSF